MPDLLETLQTIRGTGRALYIHTQALDTTTPAGRALYQMLGVFGELEREMIVARVTAGMARAKVHGTKTGNAIGRPRVAQSVEGAIRATLAKGTGLIKTAKLHSVGVSTVQRVRAAMG